MQMQARCLLEYGEAKEGYWTCENFIQQMKNAIKIAEFKYPKCEGWRHVWIFDHSSCHAAMADDSLDISKMNRWQIKSNERWLLEWRSEKNEFCNWNPQRFTTCVSRMRH